MSGDIDMLSDSDGTPGSTANNNRHVVTNGNGRGHINGDVDSSMSEEDDDDMPLVRTGFFLFITYPLPFQFGYIP